MAIWNIAETTAEFARATHERRSERDRERLVAEHDKFIAMLVADHQRDMDALCRHVAELEDRGEAKKV